jgi:hypothetical protein
MGAAREMSLVKPSELFFGEAAGLEMVRRRWRRRFAAATEAEGL